MNNEVNHQKSKKIIFKILITLIIILTTVVITLNILGKKERIGYFNILNINSEQTLKINNINDLPDYLYTNNNQKLIEYIETNSSIKEYVYNIEMIFYDKVFRYSDIFDPYIVEKTFKDNTFLKSIDMNLRIGKIITDKILSDNKIDNIYYIVRVKGIYYVVIILLSLIIIILKYNLANKLNNFLETNQRNITINVKYLIISGYLYLTLPYIIFSITWLKPIISIPIIILLGITLFLIIKEAIKIYNKEYNINLYIFISIILLIIFYTISMGIGEIFNQSGDMYNGRNAVFRDLINFKWPIIYPESGYGFVYYFAHWVIPALFGKIFGITVGNIVLILWSSFGILLAFLLTIIFFNIKKIHIITALCMFVFFNVLPNYAKGIFIEYASMMLQIYNLFNQSIGIWILCILFLYQNNSKNFAILGLSTMFYSAYSIIGIFPFMIVKLILLIKENGLKELKNTFSISNIFSSIAIFPILLLYTMSAETQNDGFKILITEHNYIRLIINYICNFGIFIFFIYNNNKKNYILYTSIFLFIFVSMIQYSQDHNFSRTNLPAMFFLCILSIDYICNTANSIKKYIFIGILIISACIPAKYISNQIYNYIFINKFKPTKQIGRTTFNTLGNRQNSWGLKTVTCQDMDESIFFKYLIK